MHKGSDKDSLGYFDRFADVAAGIVSRAPFFAFCVLLMLVWIPSIVVIRDVDTWQLIINTATTIVTFLLVALLQNTQARFEAAANVKSDTAARGLRDLMQHIEHALPCDREGCDFAADIERLEVSIGVEDDLGTS